MSLITSTLKRPSLLASCLLLGLVSLVTAGCDSPKPSTSPGPTSREAELTQTVEELRTQLAAAEKAAEQANQRAAAAEKLPPASAAQAKAEPVREGESPDQSKPADTSYVVVKKEFTAGQLIPVTSSNPNATERIPAEYRITFKGAQSGNEYPALAVKETAYNEFREGGTYSAQDLNLAKSAAPAAGSTTAPSPNSTGGNGSDTSQPAMGDTAP